MCGYLHAPGHLPTRGRPWLLWYTHLDVYMHVRRCVLQGNIFHKVGIWVSPWRCRDTANTDDLPPSTYTSCAQVQCAGRLAGGWMGRPGMDTAAVGNTSLRQHCLLELPAATKHIADSCSFCQVCMLLPVVDSAVDY